MARDHFAARVWRNPPGGGTTDYAIDMIRAAIGGERYRCFLDANETLPMTYMDDAVRATIELMEAPRANLTEHGSYNIAGVSFSPIELVAEIRRHVPTFKVEFAPDFRQRIAESWPDTIDDSLARVDWGWRPRFRLPELVDGMFANLRHSPALTREGAPSRRPTLSEFARNREPAEPDSQYVRCREAHRAVTSPGRYWCDEQRQYISGEPRQAPTASRP